MATFTDCACASDDVYIDDSHPIDGWITVKTFKTEKQKYQNPQGMFPKFSHLIHEVVDTAFKANLYRSYKDSNEYMFACRGTRTSSTGEVIRDAVGSDFVGITLLGGNLAKVEAIRQFKSAYYELQRMHGVGGFKMTLTGHSKGGFEASAIEEYVENERRKQNNPDLFKEVIGAVVFNAPGIGALGVARFIKNTTADAAVQSFNFFKRLVSDNVEKIKARPAKEEYRVLNITRKSDVVSTGLMPHLGVEYELPDFSDKFDWSTKNLLKPIVSLKNMISDISGNHSMKNMIECLKNLDSFGNIEITHANFKNLIGKNLNPVFEMAVFEHQLIRTEVDSPASIAENKLNRIKIPGIGRAFSADTVTGPVNDSIIEAFKDKLFNVMRFNPFIFMIKGEVRKFSQSIIDNGYVKLSKSTDPEINISSAVSRLEAVRLAAIERPNNRAKLQST